MRIHTNLTHADMVKILRLSGAPIDYEVLSQHGSRSHARAFDVRLTGTGGRSNTGLYGAGDYSGATWDEWGAFFGALFDLDPEARAGGSSKQPIYRDREHFHFLTGDRFQQNASGHYLPADTHPRHRWQYEGSWGDHGAAGFHCTAMVRDKQCTATRPSWKAAEAYAPRAYDVA